MKSGTNRRMGRAHNNQRVTATVGGQKCHFKSKLEYRWALYLEFLLQTGEIAHWDYEPEIFLFANEKTAPVQYTPDFKVTAKNGGIVWQECKGYHNGQTNTKLRRMAKHYPDVMMELVLQSVSTQRCTAIAGRQRVASKYVRRIIDASVIFRQLKGVIKL